jgi:predicted DCC family thiol-disulfide oxidoreductase YuxK
VLLYDGGCGLCARSVQFLLAHARPGRGRGFRFAPLEGTFGTAVRARHPALDGVDSVVWYEPGPGPDGQVAVRSAAALAALRALGGGWRVVGALAAVVPRRLRDLLYDAIARRRLDLVAPACLLPTPEQRSRFLE